MANAELKLAPVAPVSFDQEYAIGKFLSMEARVLDEERYPEWLELLTEDIRYQIPVAINTYRPRVQGHPRSNRFSLLLMVSPA